MQRYRMSVNGDQVLELAISALCLVSPATVDSARLHRSDHPRSKGVKIRKVACKDAPEPLRNHPSPAVLEESQNPQLRVIGEFPPKRWRLSQSRHPKTEFSALECGRVGPTTPGLPGGWGRIDLQHSTQSGKWSILEVLRFRQDFERQFYTFPPQPLLRPRQSPAASRTSGLCLGGLGRRLCACSRDIQRSPQR